MPENEICFFYAAFKSEPLFLLSEAGFFRSNSGYYTGAFFEGVVELQHNKPPIFSFIARSDSAFGMAKEMVGCICLFYNYLCHRIAVLAGVRGDVTGC
jgi:hypothetical protein